VRLARKLRRTGRADEILFDPGDNEGTKIREGAECEVASGRLARGIGSTCERRQAPVAERLPIAVTSEFLEDTAKQTQRAAGKRLLR